MNDGRQTSVDLVRYRPINTYVPQVGDHIIRHGWIVRTKWYGVINAIDGDIVSIITSGIPRMLFTMSPGEMKANTISISLAGIVSSLAGSYSVVKHDTNHNTVVWYI